MLDQVRIVLVRTQGPVNLGAACRALRNMGLSDLVLVSPECDPRDELAEGYAMRAKDLLQSARIVDTLEAALEGCVLTYAATGKRGPHRKQATEPAREAAERVRATVPRGRVAIAFGPEDRGLLLPEIMQFDRVLEIEAAPEYPVLNLAAAVMVVAHELQVAARVADGGQDEVVPLALDEHKRVLYDKLFDALDRIGFFSRQQTSDHLQFALRRIFGRVEMSINELDVWIGVASQLHWYVNQCGREFRSPLVGGNPQESSE